MTLEEAKEIILSNNYKILEESFIDDIIECFKKIIGPKWERIYKRIIGNNILANYIFDNRDLMPAYEIVTNVIDLEQQINEDFTMGVGAPLGADQGIPHSMDGCAVPMMRLGEPSPMGKIQKCCPHCPPPPPHRHPPIPFGLWPVGVIKTTSTKKRKKKKKKRKSKKKK